MLFADPSIYMDSMNSFPLHPSGEGPSPEEVQVFCAKWKLGENAIAKLRKCTPKEQRIVLDDFDPGNTGGRPQDGKVIMFAVSVQKRLQAGVTKDQVKQNNSIMQTLSTMMAPPQCDAVNAAIRKRCLQFMHQDFGGGSFIPNKFIKIGAGEMGLEPGMLSPKGQINVPAGSVSAEIANPNAEELIQALIIKWEIMNPEVYQKLHDLSPAGLEAISRQFDPHGEPDRAARLMVYADQLDFQMRTNPVQAFIERWNLDQSAQAKLFSLPPDAQSIVLSQFAPPPASRDVNGKLIMFAVGIQKKLKQ